MSEKTVRFNLQSDERVFPMQLTVDVRQSTTQATGSVEPSHLWILGLGAADDGQPTMSGALPYSFLGDCECPDDCLRDHENE